MPPADRLPLVIERAATMRPPRSQALQKWEAEVASCLTAQEATPYRGLVEIMFGTNGLDWRPSPRRRPVGASRRLAVAGPSQATLAAEAIDRLGDLPPCDALVLLTDSVDADFHTSTVGALAARYGLSKSVHFALSSLEGAALGAALDVLDALLPAERGGDHVLLVAAEAWPTPFPRPYPADTILADGATACLVRRGVADGGLQVLAAAQSAGDPFLDESQPCHIDRPRLLDQATGFLSDLLRAVPGAAPDCWIDSGLGDGIDRDLRRRLGLAHLPVIAPPTDEGYLAAAAAPARLSGLLDDVLAGRVIHGACFLAWGAGLGGSLGGVLIRALRPGGQS